MSIIERPTLTDDACWRAVRDRDSRFDGVFVYAVRSTGIFCRPSCPSRRADRDQLTYYAERLDALGDGYRPCRRCRPMEERMDNPHIATVSRLCWAIEDHDEGTPTLAELGQAVDVSPHHLQRVFKAVTGVSPKQYAEAVRLGRLKQSLRQGEPVASALYGAGYGSSSRLYEKAPIQLGMTPASYAKGGRGARIRFTITDVAPMGTLGRLLVAATERGICMVSLGESDGDLEAELRKDYGEAAIERDDEALARWVRAVFDLIEGTHPHAELPLDIRATAFQWQVWTRLKAIPRGETRSYQEIAAELGKPGAARAVGRACATNPVSLIVPCHRAIGADGGMHGYRWGVHRKRALLTQEKKSP
jgi:AraC family transcriptional regulator of adaptative response/methylated-DNA-[protein]-cysteine methyltransferase